MATQKKRRITAEVLYQFQIVFDCQISPDGRYVAFGVQRVDKKTEKKYANLWLAPTGGAPRQFTYGDQVDWQPRWSPDSRQLAFISNRGDEKQPQIYLIPIDGGEARPLTDLKGEFGDIIWAPDGRRLACSFRKKDQEVLDREADEGKKKLGVVERHITRLFYKADGYGFLPKERWHLWLIDAQNGKARQLTGGERYDEHSPAWSPDGQRLVFLSNRAEDPDLAWDQSDLFLIPAAGGEMQKIETPPGPKEFPRFSPDGRWIAYTHSGGHADLWRNTHLHVVPADGQGQARNLTGAFDIHLGQDTLGDINSLATMAPVWSPDSQKLYFQTPHWGDTLLKAVSLEGGEPETIIGERGVVGDFSLDRSGAKLAELHGSMASTAQIWLRDLATGRVRQLTHFNEKSLQALDMGEVEEVRFKGGAGNELQGWIIKPPGFQPEQKYPSILEIHGGPMLQYGYCLMHEFFYLAAQGYVVYFCNPRGGRGYGQDHTRAIANNWGGPDYADVMAWADLVQQKPYIDPERMGVTGGSYGGFMTNWIIGHTDRFKAAVTQRCVSNMISMTGSSDLIHIFDSLFGAPSTPWQDTENYWRQSPLSYIGNAKTPTLVIHSEHDMRTDVEQGEQVFAALKRRGVETEFVRFPEESHGLTRGGRTDRRIASLNHILRWFENHLK